MLNSLIPWGKIRVTPRLRSRFEFRRTLPVPPSLTAVHEIGTKLNLEISVHGLFRTTFNDLSQTSTKVLLLPKSNQDMVVRSVPALHPNHLLSAINESSDSFIQTICFQWKYSGLKAVLSVPKKKKKKTWIHAHEFRDYSTNCCETAVGWSVSEDIWLL